MGSSMICIKILLSIMFIFKDYITGVVFIKYKVSLFLKKITLCLYVKTTKNLCKPETNRNRSDQ